MADIEVSQIYSLLQKGNVVWTEHVALRLRERGIKRNDIISCIKNGETIEQYPNDTPYPSCLMLGVCCAGKPLHVVVGINVGVMCCIITAYRPDLDKWYADLKTRKVVK